MKLKVFFALLLIYTFTTTCSNKVSIQSSETLDLAINLRWIPSYEEETHQKIEVGLKWVLSYLGATLPQASTDDAFSWTQTNILQLDLSKAGFSDRTNVVWNQLIREYKKTSEYQQYGSLDIGKFVLLSFNSSWHYYAITDAPTTFNEFKSNYAFANKHSAQFLPDRSGVTSGIRIVHTSHAESALQIAHFAEEGTGTTIEEFQNKEIEAFDIMPNGQPRFVIYDENGLLKAGASKEISRAGKPAKCMWCHESGIQLPFRVINQFPDELHQFQSFNNTVTLQNKMLDNYYKSFLPQQDTFRNKKELHYLAELLYITYQSPTIMRAEGELRFLKKYDKIDDLSITQEKHHEFKFLKNLVRRSNLDSLTQINTYHHISSRETHPMEINLISQSENIE